MTMTNRFEAVAAVVAAGIVVVVGRDVVVLVAELPLPAVGQEES